MEPIEYTLPSHWACPLYYGDDTGLEDEEVKQIEAFLKDHIEQFPNTTLMSVEDDGENFCNLHDATPYGVLPCNCSTFIFC